MYCVHHSQKNLIFWNMYIYLSVFLDVVISPKAINTFFFEKVIKYFGKIWIIIWILIKKENFQKSCFLTHAFKYFSFQKKRSCFYGLIYVANIHLIHWIQITQILQKPHSNLCFVFHECFLIPLLALISPCICVYPYFPFITQSRAKSYKSHHLSYHF